MQKIARIHIKGPFLKAAKALIPEKPVSLGWNTKFPKDCWGFVFNGAPSQRAVNAAIKTGLHYQEEDDRSAISLPGIKESEVDKATEKFNIFADEYKSVSKKTASIITRHINEDSSVVKKINIKMGRRQLCSVGAHIKAFAKMMATIPTDDTKTN